MELYNTIPKTKPPKTKRAKIVLAGCPKLAMEESGQTRWWLAPAAAIGGRTADTPWSSARLEQRGTARTEAFRTARWMELEGWASARFSRATGQALHTCMVRSDATFEIEAFDARGERRKDGGDPFSISVRGASIVRAKVLDRGDGTYLCHYRPSVSGRYTIGISLYGRPLRGSPFMLNVLSPIPDPAMCKVHGDGLNHAIAREPTSFSIEFINAFGNVTHAEEIDCFVERIGDAEPPQKDIADPSTDGGDTTSGAAGSASKEHQPRGGRKMKSNLKNVVRAGQKSPVRQSAPRAGARQLTSTTSPAPPRLCSSAETAC